MKVLAWGKRLSPETAAQAGAEYRELEDLLRSSDVVSIHATLSEETRGLIDAKRFANEENVFRDQRCTRPNH